MCTTGPQTRGTRVELRTAPDCPNAEAARSLLAECLAESGTGASVVERVGPYRSGRRRRRDGNAWTGRGGGVPT